MVNNEIAIIKKVENKIQNNKGNVFPLSSLHRKELRELRKENVNNLNVKIRLLKQNLMNEYKNKYSEDIKIETEKCYLIKDKLNENWKEVINKINNILKERKEFEKSFGDDIKLLNLSTNYDSIGQYLELNETKRHYSFNLSEKSKEILENEFNLKYGKLFEKCTEEINKLNVAYEEALNFGDLETVKSLYYLTKNTDKFIDELKSKIKI